METEVEQNAPEKNQKQRVNLFKANKRIVIASLSLFILAAVAISTVFVLKSKLKKNQEIPTDQQSSELEQKAETILTEKSTEDEEVPSPQVNPFPFSETKNTLVTIEDRENSVAIYAININNKERVKFLEIVKPSINNNYQIEKDRPAIQIANNGALVYTLDNTSLYFYDRDIVTKRYVSNNEFGFSLSPTGEYVIIIKAEPKEDINVVSERYSQINNWEYVTQHYFYKVLLESKQPAEFLLQKDLTDNTYDSETYFRFVDWSQVQSTNPWLQTWSLGQLSHTPNGLYELRVEEKEIVDAFPLIDQGILNNRRFLNVSTDNRHIAYCNTDAACCGGINYTNNQTYTFNLDNKEEKKIFDEYDRYGNSTKSHTEQHETKSLSFSPNNSLVAQTIYNLYRTRDEEEGAEKTTTSASLLITDINGNEKALFNNYALIGWLDNEVIVAAKKTVKSYLGFYSLNWWENEYNSIDIINVNTGDIETIYSGSFNDFGMLN